MRYRNDIEGMETVEEWLAWLSERGRTDKTIEIYRSAMRHCLNVLHDAGFDTRAECMGEREVYYLYDDDGKESSRRFRISVFRMFVEWATGRDPGEDTELLWNGEDRERCFISETQFNRMLGRADPRERLILMLGACMGLRRAEIVDLRISDIDGDTLTVYGKGHGTGKRAVLYIPDVVRDAIDRYMRVRPETGVDHLIVDTVRGGTHPLPYFRIYDLIKRLGDEVDVDVTPHALRRLFATRLRDQSVELDDIRTLMRHKRVETTLDCYIRPDPKRLKNIMRNFNI